MATERNEHDNQTIELEEAQKEAVKIANNETVSDMCEEGDRMVLLRKAVSMTKKKCLSAGRFSLFASSFEPVMKEYPKALKRIHQQFQQLLEKSIDEEITKLYNEENLVGYMNQLEDLNQKADMESVAWRPSGIVKDDLRAHLHPLKLKQRDRLQKLEEILEDEHRHLRDAVEARRNKFLETEKVILDHVSGITMAHCACEELPLEPVESFKKLS